MRFLCLMMRLLRALCCAVYLALATFFFATLVLLGGLVTWVVPLKSWHRFCLKHLVIIPVLWADSFAVVIKWVSRKRFTLLADTHALSTQQWYLLIGNHQSFLDILMIQHVFRHQAPAIKFFMKKELLWSLPVAGLACWVLGYPFMQRHSREQIRRRPELKNKDMQTTHEACEKFKAHPTTVMNFVEGTRFTPEKKAKQNSPYHYLLKPKSAGIAITMNELKDHISHIIDVTIFYKMKKVTLWNFLMGNFSAITFHYELLPLSDELIGNYYQDREFRKRCQRWLNQRWAIKDQLMQDADHGSE